MFPLLSMDSLQASTRFSLMGLCPCEMRAVSLEYWRHQSAHPYSKLEPERFTDVVIRLHLPGAGKPVIEHLLYLAGEFLVAD